eukprot:scaffold523_cov446-Prasinococcus_capsulatus_cf.AAC.12
MRRGAEPAEAGVGAGVDGVARSGVPSALCPAATRNGRPPDRAQREVNLQVGRPTDRMRSFASWHAREG